jgi:hypothetical protein
VDRISQRSSKSSKRNLHDISIFQSNPGAETQTVRPEKMDMDVARPPMCWKLKMVVFHIQQTVAHLCLAGPELC